MPPVVAAVGAVAGAIGGAVSAVSAFTIGGLAVGSFVVNTALSIGLSFVAKALTPKKKDLGSSSTTGSSLSVTIREPTAARRLVYGQTRIGGTIAYINSVNYSDGNNYLIMAIVLCDGPITAIDQIYLNDEAVTIDPGSAVVTSGTFAGYVTINTYTGDASQVANPMLMRLSGGAWTSAHRLQGIAYLAVALTWNQNVFSSGVPNITAVVRGKEVYDPRTTSTAYSANAALVLRDFLTTTTARGGVGALSSEIDDTSFSAAANICDEDVTLSGGGTENRYEVNGTLTLDENSTPQPVIESILTSCGGRLSFVGGKWKLLPAAWRSPTFTLTDSMLRGPLKVDTRISRRDQFNAVKGTFRNPADRWVAKDYPAFTSSTFEAEDGGTRIYRDINFDWTTSAPMAQRLAKIELYRSRLPITVQAQCNLMPYAVTVGDVINVTHSRWGWTNKTFEAMQVSWAVLDDGGLGIDLVLRETNSAVYDWSATEERLLTASPSTSFPNWNAIGAPLVNLSAGDAELFLAGDGSIVSRIRVDITPTTSLVDRWEIRWKLSADSTWTDPVSIGASGSNVWWISPIVDETEYDVEVRGVTVLGTRSAWFGVYNFLALGKSAIPNDVTAIQVANGIVKWAYDQPADFAGFRVRYQSGAYAVWSSASDLIDGLLTIGQINLTNLLTGIVTILVKAVDRSGNESANAASLIVDLGTGSTANIVAVVDYEALGYPGFTSGEIDGSGHLVGSSTSLFWAADARTPFYPPGADLFWASGTYGDVVWPFSFSPDSSMAGTDLVLGYSMVGSPWSIQYRIDGATAMWRTADASLFWTKAAGDVWWDGIGDYQPWPGRVSPVTLTRHDFIVTALGGAIQPVVADFQVILDAPDLSETLSNVAVLAAGTRLPLTKSFRAINTVQLTVQGTAATSARAEDKAASGPLVVAFNGSGTPVDASVDAIVQGY